MAHASQPVPRPGAWAIERVHTFTSLMIFSGAFLGLYMELDPGSHLLATSGSQVAKALWAFIFWLAVPFQLRLLWPMLRRFVLREPFCLALVGLALVSPAWSLLPDVSLRRAVLLFATIQYGAYLSARYTWTELCDMARTGLRLGLLLSCFVSIVFPSVGVHEGILGGRWRGLFLHKNTFGRIGGLLATLSYSQAAAGMADQRKWVWFDFTLAAIVLMVSGSRTALGVCLGVFLIVGLCRLWLLGRGALRLGMASLAVLVAGILLPAVYLSYDLLANLDWDSYLTGRVSLWKTVIYLVAQHPLTGYGYKAFFEPEAFGRLVLLFEGWRAPHAHNVVLELVADLGLLAIPLYLMTMSLFLLRLLRSPRLAALLPLGIWCFNVLTGLTETACYPDSEVASLLFVFFAFNLSPQAYPSSPSGLNPAEENGPAPSNL